MLKFRCLLFISVLCFAFPAVAQENASFSPEQLKFYETKVRPLLAARCLECHGANLKEPKGGLSLESRADVLRGGESGPSAVAGKPGDSLLIEAVNYESFEMPPRSKLPEGEIAILSKWVSMGMPFSRERKASSAHTAEFPLEQRKASHWAWQPVQKPSVPTVKNAGWASDDIDRFILAAVEKNGLTSAPLADRRTLIRRAFFAIIGLPPSPQDVDRFVNDPAPDREAFARVVDELLASPHFGERWGRHWLDLTRYAETLGHEFDYPLHHATVYRDYVIRAFNADVPYNQFVKEHIAGDLLRNPRRNPEQDFNESIIGTGFWFLGEDKHAPVDVRGEEAGKIDNQIDVFSKTFLGLTVACARCHDHKFDAIKAADYYALAGFLQSSRRQTAYLDPGRKIENATNVVRAKQSEISGRLNRQLSTMSGRKFADHLLAAQKVVNGADVNAVASKTSLNADTLKKWTAALKSDAIKNVSHPLYAWHALATQPDSRAFREQQQALADKFEQAKTRRDQRLTSSELFEDFSQANNPNWYSTGFAFRQRPITALDLNTRKTPRLLPDGVAESSRVAPRLRGVLRSRTFELKHKQILYRVAGEKSRIRLIIDGYVMDEFSGLLFGGAKIDVNTGGEFKWIRQAGDVSRYVGHRCHIELIDDGDGWIAVDEIRFTDGAPEPTEAPNPILLTMARNKFIKSTETLATVYGHMWKSLADGPMRQFALVNWVVENGLLPDSKWLVAAAADVNRVADKIPTPQRAIAICDGSPENEHLFIRGDHKNLGKPVPRQMLTAIAGEKQAIPQDRSGRLELAQQVVDPANPFASRVIVNRIWHHLIGRGIVASTDNFGVLGERPTHPELLDHLATRFMDQNWSIKQLIRDIMLTSVYRQSSAPSAIAAETDPGNRWLSHAHVRRLEAEAIRDSLLSISGRLKNEMFGGSVPVHLTAHMQGRGRPGQNGPLDGNGRRSIYIAVRRNFLSPSMLAFDMPIPFTSIGRRTISNVPAQALILMNDPFVQQQARRWADESLKTNQSVEQRIQSLYQSAYARKPEPTEIENARGFLQRQADAKSIHDWNTNPEIWADLCHVLINVKEFIYLR